VFLHIGDKFSQDNADLFHHSFGSHYLVVLLQASCQPPTDKKDHIRMTVYAA
jgi:hypothetical protein